MSKIVLVTGASSGIGQSISRLLCQQGHTVYGASRTAVPGTKIHGVIQMQVDVTSEASVEALIKDIIGRSGQLDVVINCAGLTMIASGEETDEASMKALFETNVFGAMRVCRYATAHQREAQSGYLINLVAAHHRFGMPYRSVYAAANAALSAFSQSLRLELNPFHIHVVEVEAGEFQTSLFNHRLRTSKETNSDYSAGVEGMTASLEKRNTRAMKPEPLGHLIGAIILNPKPKRLYRTHKLGYLLGRLIKLVLPIGTYQRYVLWAYKLPQKITKKSDD